MPRLLGPDENTRLGYRLVGGRLNSSAGLTATVYTDAAATTLAVIYTYDGTLVPGAAISGSTLTVNSDSKLPLFWFPADVDTVYVKIGTGTATAVYADSDFRLDEIKAALARGYKGLSVDPALTIATGNIITAGVLHLAKVYLGGPGTATNIVAHVTSAGATLTSGQCLAGLYDDAGTRLAQTATMHATWDSTGAKVMPLTAAFGLSRQAFVYAALLGNGTTMPQFSVGSTTPAANMGLAAGTATRFGTILTGQTSLPATITPASIAVSNIAWAITLT